MIARVPVCSQRNTTHSSPEARTAEPSRRDWHKQERNQRTPAERSTTSLTESASFLLAASKTTVISVPLQRTQPPTASQGCVWVPPIGSPDPYRHGHWPRSTGQACPTHHRLLPSEQTPGPGCTPASPIQAHREGRKAER